MAFDTELQRRSALAYWPKAITADGTIDSSDGVSLLGGYPFDVPNINADVMRFSVGYDSLWQGILEITKRYRK
jgi:hypothetical protein